MFRSRERLSVEARGLLDSERGIPPLPPAARARAVARARAAMAAPPVAERPAPTGPPHPLRWAAAAGLIFLAMVAGGAGAYELGVRTHLPAYALPAPPDVRAPAVGPPADRSSDAPEVRWRGAASPPSRATLVRAELRLLERARAAVAREDFAAALPPLAEHARRFRDGHLTEEREALRVKALSGLGRTAEARRAVAAFEARFPRSPLLSAVNQMVNSGP